MTEAEIRQNIRYNENLIDQYMADRSNYQREIEELEALKSKYTNLQNDFGNRQQYRRGKLTNFLHTGLQNSIITKYYNGMNELLNGAEFNNAYNGINDAKYKIDQKINEIVQRVYQCDSDITYRRNRRDYWKAQLRSLQAEEAE